VLADWKRDPPKGLETWLITKDPFTAYSGMIPGWIAGHYDAGANLIDLRSLAGRAGAKLVIDTLEGLDADRNSVILSNGMTISFDRLSLATGGEVDTSLLAALGERLLPVRPVNEFVSRWPRIVEQAARGRGFHLVVVGGGAAGVEIALAAQHAFDAVSPTARVSIVTAENTLLSGHSPAVVARVESELAVKGIDVRFASAVGADAGLILSDGTVMEADCVIATTGSKAPRWLKSSGLALDEQGFVRIGADLRSISHGTIFAAGDIVTRVDRNVARSGVHAVRAGPVLAANLRASVIGSNLSTYVPKRRTLYLLATGDKRAILSWGRFAASGKLIWRLKDWIDRRFVKRYVDLGRRPV
jgi:pyridine nucleotide-disulfide oxidoreductase family protein